MKTIRFYKEDGLWYIDLPDWRGPKHDLEMIMGANKALDIISNTSDEVSIIISQSYFPDCNVLDFIKTADENLGGAFYKMEIYERARIDLEMYLCDVTKLLFGKFPKNFYYKVIKKK